MLVYLVLCSSLELRKVELALEKTKLDCFPDTPTEIFINRVKENLKTLAK